MSVRQDNVNLILTINGIQSAKTLQEMEKSARDLRRLLTKIPVDSTEFKEASKRLQELDGRIKQTKAGMTAMRQESGLLGSTVAKLIGVYTTVTIALRGFFSVLTGSSKLEQLNIAFEVFLGSADKAKRVVADLRKFADVTPFETEPVINAGRALLAFGFTAEDLIPTLTRVGDVAAGTGKDFNKLALIYGKARAEGIIQNDTLNQLAEAGIPVYEELAKILDVDTSKIRKLAENGEISFNRLQQVFVNLTSEGGRFAGLMERQSQSMDGLFSTLVSAIQNKLIGAMNGLLPIIKTITRAFIDFLSVPLSETLEQERQAFNGVALAVLSAKEGTQARTDGIKKLQEQYPQFLGSLDAEKATNEQLKPILDRINQSYVIRIALQKQQEKIQPILEAAAERETQLANERVVLNKTLARAAEISGVNLAAYKTEQEQVDAVTDALRKQAVFSQGQGQFATRTALNEQARLLERIEASGVGILVSSNAQQQATQKLSEAESRRQDIIAEMRKTYGELVDDILNPKVQENTGGDAGGGGNAKDQAKKLKEAIELELQEIDIRFAKEELAALRLKNDGLIRDEREFGIVMAQLQEQQLEAQLQVYRIYGQDQTKQALDLQKKLLEIQAGRNVERPAPLSALPGAGLGSVTSQTAGAETAATLAGLDETTVLRDKFARIVDLEQQHELRIAEIRRNAATERLRVLQEQGLFETEAYQAALEQRAEADDNFQEKLKENQRRTTELKRLLEEEAISSTSDAISLGIELLSRDEAARKKNAAAIKTFQIAQVQVSGIAEIQKIWEKAAQFGPLQSVIAGIQTALAAARMASAIAKISSAKFDGGGFTGPGFGIAPDNTGHRPVGVVHANEWVSPPWMTQHPVWGAQIAALESVRRRGFADGGFATTPTVSVTPAAVAAGAGAAGVEGLQMLALEWRDFRREVNAWQGRLRVAYTDVEDAGSDLSIVRTEASI